MGILQTLNNINTNIQPVYPQRYQLRINTLNDDILLWITSCDWLLFFAYCNYSDYNMDIDTDIDAELVWLWINWWLYICIDII